MLGILGFKGFFELLSLHDRGHLAVRVIRVIRVINFIRAIEDYQGN